MFNLANVGSVVRVILGHFSEKGQSDHRSFQMLWHKCVLEVKLIVEPVCEIVHDVADCSHGFHDLVLLHMTLKFYFFMCFHQVFWIFRGKYSNMYQEMAQNGYCLRLSIHLHFMYACIRV